MQGPRFFQQLIHTTPLQALPLSGDEGGAKQILQCEECGQGGPKQRGANLFVSRKTVSEFNAPKIVPDRNSSEEREPRR